MIVVLTFVVMIAVGYAAIREGVLTALCTLINVVLAGVVTFNFFEPLATQLDGMFQNSAVSGYEDALSMFALFCLSLGGLRVVTNNLANQELDLPARLQQVLSVLVALVTGYLVAGFLVCMLQTLPLTEKFLGFEREVDPQMGGLRRMLPPDRVWLGMMHRMGAGPLSWEGNTTFDPEGTFELRYARYRRIKE